MKPDTWDKVIGIACVVIFLYFLFIYEGAI